MNIAAAFACFLFAASASALPLITSVAPVSGPLTGGTTVTIRGTGFSNACAAPCTTAEPVVFFGVARAASSTLVDANTIVAVTPVHLPVTVAVFVSQSDGSSTLANAFTFTGNVADAYERILLPYFAQPIRGAFGSEFRSEFHLANKSPDVEMSYFGLPSVCSFLCPTPPPDAAISVRPGEETSNFFNSGSPGRLIFTPKPTFGGFAANLRVFDVSRQSQTLGTEIPVVRDIDFQSDSVALVGVPLDSRYRNTLRVYSDGPAATTVRATVGGATTVIALRAGTDLFDPAYAELASFPPSTVVGAAPTRVLIEPLEAGRRIWALITVTNNDTQQITTVTPQ